MSELMHYGRKGMKWYQHIFGEIDKRAAYASKKLKEKSEAKKAMDKETSLATDKRALRRLSDQELNERLKRLELEKRYVDLVAEKNPKIKKGKSFVSKLLENAGMAFVTQFSGAYGREVGAKAGKKTK